MRCGAERPRRAAVNLVPGDQQADLAAQLCTQLGRGGGQLRRSLSRAFVTLDQAASPALHEYSSHRDASVRVHALATQRLLHDPEEGFEAAVVEARRFVALTGDPSNSIDPRS